MKNRITKKLEHAKTLWDGVKSHLGLKSGGGPEILHDNGKFVQDPKEMSNVIQNAFQRKRQSLDTCLGDTSANYLKVTRNFTRGRCRIFSFIHIT